MASKALSSKVIFSDSAIFFITGSRIHLFILICVAILAVLVYVAWGWKGWRSNAEFLIAAAAVALYSFGILVVRVMLNRSVSLKLLASYAETGEGAAKEGIAGRLEDLRRYRLVRRKRETYELSAFGKFISGIVTLSYLALKIK